MFVRSWSAPLAVVVFFAAVNPIHAVEFTLTSNGLWISSNSWTPSGGPPSNVDTAVLANGRTATLDVNRSIAGLKIGTGNVTGNGTLTVNGPLTFSGLGGGAIRDGIDLVLNGQTDFVGPGPGSFDFASIGVANTYSNRETTIVNNDEMILRGRSGFTNVTVSPGSNYPERNLFTNQAGATVTKLKLDSINDDNSDNTISEIQIGVVNHGTVTAGTGTLRIALADGQTSTGTFRAAQPNFFGLTPTLRLVAPDGGTHTLGTTSSLEVGSMDFGGPAPSLNGNIEFAGSTGTIIVNGNYEDTNLRVTGGTVDFMSDATVRTLQVTGGQVINRGGLVVSNLAQFGGTTRLAGDLTGDITATGGTVAGVGTVTGNVTISGNASFAPGNSPGEIGVDGDLSWRNGATFDYDLGPAAGGDLAVVQNAFLKTTGGTGGYQFSFNYDESLTTGTYDLVEFGSTTFTQSDFSYIDVSPFGQLEGSFDLTGDRLSFIVTSVEIPEPTTLALLALGLSTTMVRRRS